MNGACNGTFLALPLAPKGGVKRSGAGDPNNCAAACAIHASNSHTKSSLIWEKKIGTPNPPRYPQHPPLGHDPGVEIKI